MPAALPPEGRALDTNWIGGWVYPSAGPVNEMYYVNFHNMEANTAIEVVHAMKLNVVSFAGVKKI
jgi:hypothetical protein